jgi:hypothetical protein
MHTNALKDGWQRFQDRLRRLWGQRPAAGFRGPPVNALAAGSALNAVVQARG